jgi:hypothetical protein
LAEEEGRQMKLAWRRSETIVGLLLLALVAGSEPRNAKAAPLHFYLMAAGERADGSARITKKTVVLERKDREKASISFPVVSISGDQEVLKNVQKAVDLKAGTDKSLEEWKEELKESWWLEEIDYTVSYNKHSIFSLTYSVSGTGAYPDTWSTHLVVDLKTGRSLHADDIIEPTTLKTLAATINRRLRAEVKKSIRQHAAEMGDLTKELGEARFTVKDLDHFLIEERGITFFFDFGFPHVVQALEPSGRYFLSYADLGPYLRKDGPLGFNCCR